MKLLYSIVIYLVFAPTAMAVSLTIHIPNHNAIFQVEVANTPEAQRKGLMFRTSLPDNAGMLFPYDPPHIVYMWMRNTLIPLDMLFIDANGVIVHIVENAKPKDETVISSRYNVSSVLELNGGIVKKYGISIGNRLSITQ